MKKQIIIQVSKIKKKSKKFIDSLSLYLIPYFNDSPTIYPTVYYTDNMDTMT